MSTFTLPSDVAVPFVYAKWSPLDWIEGTENFTLELEGFYCRFMNRLYKRGRALPDDDGFMSKQMDLSVRVWRRLKAVLVEQKKVVVVNGCLTNLRFEKERLERASMLRKQSEAAVAIHENRRKKNASVLKFEQSLAKTSPQTSPNFGPNSTANTNEINDLGLGEHGHYKSKSLEEERKKEPPVSPPVGDGVHRSVWMGADGLPKVVNGKRAALEKLLGGRSDLDAVLTEIAPNLTGGSEDDLWVELTAAVAAAAVSPKPKRKRQTVPDEYTHDFEEFWKLYPRREGKGAAFKAWGKLSMPQRRKAYRSLREQLPALTAKLRTSSGNVCPHPATWINGGRFDDDVQPIESLSKSNYRNGQYVGELL